jgi:hypothetical protein|tara:strand:+ start:127 stop:423 length:297 start_codon:yes stop_codon:yes gene_type:complete
MAQEIPPQISEETKVVLDLKTIGIIVSFVISLTTVYFTLKSDIALAMEMPEPEISKVEYELKDELVRQTIMDTQEDVDLLLDKFEKLEERIYELTKER